MKSVITIAAAALAGLTLLAGCAGTNRYDTAPGTYGGTYGGGYEPRYAGEGCPGCGTVQRIEVIEEGSRGVGAGAVLGTIAGGVLGSQVGSGTGKTAATIAGAAAGGYAGHQAEQRYGGRVDYRVIVDLDAGGTTAVIEDDDPRVRVGQEVQVVNGSLIPRR